MQLSAILTPFTLTASLFVLLVTPATAQTRDALKPAPYVQTQADDSLLEMNQAYRKGDRKRMAALLPQLRGHVLEPWAAYWELRNRLDTASPAEVQAFFVRFAGTYQEDRLRNDWLLQLGQRRDWTAFALEHPSYRMSDDREVRCYALAIEQSQNGVDLKRANVDVAAEVTRLWYAQREADDGCAFAANLLHDAKKLGDEAVWRRARLAMEANRPRAAKQAADMVVGESAVFINEIQDNAARFLAKRVIAPGKVAKEWVVLALIRMAVNDADAAAGALENQWNFHLSAEQRSWVWGVVGKSAAQRLSNDAPSYFAKARDADLSDDQLGWKVRAALRKGSWKDVLATTLAMSDEARQDSAWVYWRAKAQLKLAKTEADKAEANAALQQLAGVRGFYEQLALEDLGQRITVPSRPAALTTQEKDAARQNPGLNRALVAIQIGLRSEGVREWNYTTNLHTPWPVQPSYGTAASTPASAPSPSSTWSNASPCLSKMRWCSAPPRSGWTRPMCMA
jgi:soluble lytic murein transglycosylase